ncbi:hypothetical protein Goklo_018786 [Gossypium klotzschianum]|uniref:protein-tyrosine-phosphatase n=1 Tax=Gossypium klotzschianum TaxID=34286 RepID=A0A7J8ULZ9_9ROSI|nr:hypothetical protein [Gossypium klotzschianum]
MPILVKVIGTCNLWLFYAYFEVEGESFKEEDFIAMSRIDDSMQNQIAALLRVINFTRTFREDTVPCEIEAGLFLGSIAAANNMDALKSLNITHILTVASSLKPVHTNDFVYKVIPGGNALLYQTKLGGNKRNIENIGKESTDIMISTIHRISAYSTLEVLMLINVLSPIVHPKVAFNGYSKTFLFLFETVLDKEDTNLSQYFDECFNFIDEAKREGGGVLVHCFVGKSRSVTIVVAYLMKKHGMSLSQALEHVRSKRPLASPNPGFIQQLKEFEKSLQG